MMVTIERSSFSSRISLHRLPFPSHLCHYQEARKKRQKAFFTWKYSGMLYLDYHRGIAHYTLASWRVLFMPVSVTNSKLIYAALKACDVKIISALPETWLFHPIHMAAEDPAMILVRLSKKEKGIPFSAGRQ